MTAQMTDDAKVAVVRRMLAAWDALDWDGIVALFAEDGVLHSVMQEPVVGVLEVRGGLVTEWLEYFDRATLAAGLGAAE